MKCSICDQKNLQMITGTLRGGTLGRVLYCSKCDFGMLEKKITNVKKYYTGEYRKKHGDDQKITQAAEMFQLHKNFQQERLKIVGEYASRNKTFLEIGCSAGQFLSHILNKYKKVVGIEFDPSCVAFLKRKFKILVYQDEVAKLCLKDREFDQIAAFQVLEHTLDPIKFLRDIRRIMKDNGKLFLEVPNIDDPLLKLWPVPEYQSFYYHEAHNFYFSLHSLKLLCRQAGLRIEKHYFLQDYNLFNHLYWYFNNASQGDSSFGLSVPKIKFRPEKFECGDVLNQWFAKIDQQYKRCLQKYGLTSNIFLVISKAQSL